MTDPFATPDPQAPQEPTPVYDSANPAGSAPQAPQPNELAPVLYGESVTFTETSTPAPNPSPAYGAPADPSAATFSAPAYSAPVDPNAAAFNAPAYGGAPAAADPNAAAFKMRKAAPQWCGLHAGAPALCAVPISIRTVRRRLRQGRRPCPGRLPSCLSRASDQRGCGDKDVAMPRRCNRFRTANCRANQCAIYSEPPYCCVAIIAVCKR